MIKVELVLNVPTLQALLKSWVWRILGAIIDSDICISWATKEADNHDN